MTGAEIKTWTPNPLNPRRPRPVLLMVSDSASPFNKAERSGGPER